MTIGMERETHIQIRISKQDKDQFKLAAKAAGLSLSAWMRYVAINYARRIVYAPVEKKSKTK